jgi:photosystem II stability/assembly factor-like uncharacterized protein
VWHDDLYHSTDGGRTFTKMNMTKASAAYHVFLNPGHPNVVYFVPEWGESWVSANGGATWTVSTTTPRPALSSHWKWDFSGKMSGVAGDPRDPQKGWGYARATFFRTVDGGLNWTDSANGFTGFAWGWWHKSMAWDPDQPLRWMMFCYDIGPQKTENDGLWFTSHGVPWEWIGYGPGLVRWGGAYSGEFQPGSNGQVVLCNFGDYFYTKLLRSTDGGNTWTIVIDQNDEFWFVGFHPTAPNVAWAGPYRSLDGGATWTQMTALTDLGEYAEVIGYAPAQPDTVYAAWQGTGRIYRSDDRGATWRLYVDASFKFGLMDRKPVILPHPTDANSLIALNSSTGGLSRYGGTSWTDLAPIGIEGGTTTNFVRTIAIDPRYPDIMYAAMNTPGLAQIFRTADGGQTWEDISSNLSRVGGGGLQVSPYTGDLLHGSCFGTWVYPPPYDSPNALYHRLAGSGTVIGWESLADHGPAGEMAMSLADGATEPRKPGLSEVRITFDSPIDPATAGLGAVTINGNVQGDLSGQIQSAGLDASGTVLTVTLTESLPDSDVYHIAVTDQVRTSDDRPIGGDRDLVLQVLAGDVDGSGAVTATDILAVRASVGNVLDAATAHYDVDGSGALTGGDLLAVRRYLGRALP